MAEKMRDEFRGNFSKDAFDPDKGFSRILMQQGRVLLDSDFNVLQDLVTYYLRTMAKDLIGPRGGIKDEENKIDSFKINLADDLKDITIAPGHYYVDGILCINELVNKKPIKYTEQKGYFSDKSLNSHSDGISPLDIGKSYFIYLDVWERSISYIQDDTLLETALGIGDADTTVRSKVVWQVKALERNDEKGCGSVDWENLYGPRGLLKAGKANPEEDGTKGCIVSQGVHLTVQKNLLLRVEIHRAGKVEDKANPPTFKWSCVNGSADFKIIPPIDISTETKETNEKWDIATVTLDHALNSEHLSLKVGDIVEIVDDIYILARQAFALWRVDSIDEESNQVILKRNQPKYSEDVGADKANNPLLRRWDQKKGDSSRGGLTLSDDYAALIKETSDGKDNLLNLGMGIAIQFQKPEKSEGPFNYRTGDYWLIPVRALSEVEWNEGRSPHGIEHHYAPLAIISIKADGTGTITIDHDCRSTFGGSATQIQE
jgi:hypothetical protein